MAKINLRDYYPSFTSDYPIEVPDDVLIAFEDSKKAEEAYHRRKYRNKAQYSLDCDDGIENDILFVSLSPDEIYERQLTSQQLHAAIAALPDKQAKRIYAHYFMDMSKAEIAKAEGVNKSQVTRSIAKALKSIEAFLKSFM